MIKRRAPYSPKNTVESNSHFLFNTDFHLDGSGTPVNVDQTHDSPTQSTQSCWNVLAANTNASQHPRVQACAASGTHRPQYLRLVLFRVGILTYVVKILTVRNRCGKALSTDSRPILGTPEFSICTRRDRVMWQKRPLRGADQNTPRLKFTAHLHLRPAQWLFPLPEKVVCLCTRAPVIESRKFIMLFYFIFFCGGAPMTQS